MLNRWWTLALAVFVLASCVVSLPAVAFADWSSSGGLGDGTTPGAKTPGVPDPGGSGDPDSPSTSGRTGKPGFGVGRPGSGIYGARATDSAAMAGRGIWMLRVRIALDTFRLLTLRF